MEGAKPPTLSRHGVSGRNEPGRLWRPGYAAGAFRYACPTVRLTRLQSHKYSSWNSRPWPRCHSTMPRIINLASRRLPSPSWCSCPRHVGRRYAPRSTVIRWSSTAWRRSRTISIHASRSDVEAALQLADSGSWVLPPRRLGDGHAAALFAPSGRPPRPPHPRHRARRAPRGHRGGRGVPARRRESAPRASAPRARSPRRACCATPCRR